MAHKQPGSLELHSAFVSSSQRRWEYPLQLLTKWKDLPSSISSLSNYTNHHLLSPKQVSASEMQFASEWETSGYREMSTVPVALGLSLPTPAAAAYGRLGLILQQNYTQCKHENKILMLLDQGNNCWAFLNAKPISSSNGIIPHFPFCLSSLSKSQSFYLWMQKPHPGKTPILFAVTTPFLVFPCVIF